MKPDPSGTFSPGGADAGAKGDLPLSDRRRAINGEPVKPQTSTEAVNDPYEGNREGRDRGLLEWLALVRDGKIALGIAVALGILVGILATVLQKTEYEAQGSVVVSSAKGFLSPENADA